MSYEKSDNQDPTVYPGVFVGATIKRVHTPFDKFHDLQHTIETQRSQMIYDGGNPDAVLLGPTAWAVLDNYALELGKLHGPMAQGKPWPTPGIATLNALTIIRTQDDTVTVVQTWETQRRARRPFQPEPTNETP